MKKVTVIGKTDVVITLNKIGVPIRGKSIAVLDICNSDQEQELNVLIRDGLLELVSNGKKDNNSSDSFGKPDLTIVAHSKAEIEFMTDANENTVKKSKMGRPKGSKNKKNLPDKDIKPAVTDSLAKSEGNRISEAEAKTQKLRSRVVVSTLDGTKERNMTRNAIDDINESEQTRASLEAMKKLEKEESMDVALPDTKINESNLGAAEQMGRKAVVSNQAGTKSVGLTNSIIPDSSKKIDPFIDKKDNKGYINSSFINLDIPNGDDSSSDAFIEI